MSSLIKILAVISVLLFVNGCVATAKGPTFTYSSPSSVEKAYVTHYRVGSGYGGLVTEYLYSNEHFVTHIMYEGYYKEIVDPGVYEYRKLLRWTGIFRFNLGAAIDNAFARIKPALTLRAEPDKEYFIIWEVKFGKGLMPRLIAKEQALNELQGLKQFDFKGNTNDTEALLKERSSK